MLEMIKTYYDFYNHKNELCCVKTITKMVDTSINSLLNEVVYINWENLERYNKIFPFFFCTIDKTRKGRVVEFFGSKGYDRIFIAREWKTDLNIRVQIAHKIVKPSMPELMQWDNAFEAIQYMAERGIQVIINANK